MKTKAIVFILVVSALLTKQTIAQVSSAQPMKPPVTAVVSATAMNVLYVGVENPVSIAVPGYSSNQITATGCGIRFIQGQEYIARPDAVGIDTILITATTGNKTQVFNSVFRVRRIPDPYVYMAGLKGSVIKVGALRSITNIEVKNPDFIFNISYKVTSFEMVYAAKMGNVVSDVSYSDQLSKMMKDIMVRAKPGDVIVLNNVMINMPDGRSVPLSTSYKVIG